MYGGKAHQLTLFVVVNIAHVKCVLFATNIDSMWHCLDKIVVFCSYIL